MCQFLETIQLLDGEFKRLDLHQARMEKAMADFYPNEFCPVLSKRLNETDFPKVGLFKCRVIYDAEIRLIEFIPYVTPIINTLKIVDTDIASLPYKMADRTEYQKVFAKKDVCDDVLLVKNGLLTDTSYCNIALFDGKQWFTPRYPLVMGVNRAELLAKGILEEKEIKLDTLMNFQRISLFNALNEFGKIEMQVSSIHI